MSKYNQIDVTADKIFSGTGEKNISYLLGEKFITLLSGLVDKQTSLMALKNITMFEELSDKVVNLDGQKYTDDLSGLKNIDMLSGDTDKMIDLIADADGDGWWYILVDSTYITIDDMLITIDRTPNL